MGFSTSETAARLPRFCASIFAMLARTLATEPEALRNADERSEVVDGEPRISPRDADPGRAAVDEFLATQVQLPTIFTGTVQAYLCGWR